MPYKKEGEACGAVEGFHAGYCESGLECVRHPTIMDGPGKCKGKLRFRFTP